MPSPRAAAQHHADAGFRAHCLRCEESRVSNNPKLQITYTSLFTVSIHN